MKTIESYGYEKVEKTGIHYQYILKTFRRKDTNSKVYLKLKTEYPYFYVMVEIDKELYQWIDLPHYHEGRIFYDNPYILPEYIKNFVYRAFKLMEKYQENQLQTARYIENLKNRKNQDITQYWLNRQKTND